MHPYHLPRRGWPRMYTLKNRVVWSPESAPFEYDATVIDVSTSGVALRVPSAQGVGPGDAIRIVRDGRAPGVAARVVRLAADGAGVRLGCRWITSSNGSRHPGRPAEQDHAPSGNHPPKETAHVVE